MAETDDKGKGGDTPPNDDKAMEALAGKLAKAAGGADTSALKEIVNDFYRDAVDLRTKNRELNTQLTEIRKRLPKEGEVLLTGDDAKTWATIQKIGIPAADIQKQLTEGSAAQQKLTLLERDKIADEAAKALSYHAPTLRAVARLHNLNIQIQSVDDPSGALDAEGKKKKIRHAVVIPEGDKAEPVPLQDYVDEHLGDFRDALAGSEAERNGSREPPAPRIPRQKSGEGGRGGVTDEALEQEITRRHGGALRV